MRISFPAILMVLLLCASCGENYSEDDNKATPTEETEIVADPEEDDYFVTEKAGDPVEATAYAIDWMNPESVVKAMISAAREKNMNVLNDMCRPRPGVANTPESNTCYQIPGYEGNDPLAALAQAKIQGNINMDKKSASVPISLAENEKALVQLIFIDNKKWYITGIENYKPE